MPETTAMFTVHCARCSWGGEFAHPAEAERGLSFHTSVCTGSPSTRLSIVGTIIPAAIPSVGWTPTDDQRFQEMFR